MLFLYTIYFDVDLVWNKVHFEGSNTQINDTDFQPEFTYDIMCKSSCYLLSNVASGETRIVQDSPRALDQNVMKPGHFS